MKSESEATLTGDTVPSYLRAYGSTYRSGRFGQQYKSIGNGGDGEEQQGKPGGGAAGLFVLRRALGALAVFVGFAVAVSSTSSRWPTGEWGPAGPGQGLQGVTYREMFEVSSLLFIHGWFLLQREQRDRMEKSRVETRGTLEPCGLGLYDPARDIKTKTSCCSMPCCVIDGWILSGVV